MPEQASSTPIWDFVLNYYGRKGVSEALIGLQDSHGIDVNMLLFLMWMAAQKKSVAAGDIKLVSDASHPWQRSVVVPIRGVRRLLKDNAPLVAPDAAAAFRKKVQAIELEGEQLQLNAMAALAAKLTPASARSAEDAARQSIKAFEGVTATPFPPPAVDTLARALAEVADAR
jgi:uncharacterized protein (TIGR02444 family)